MQIDILGNTTVIGIEVAVIPLVTAVILTGAIVPTVITAYSQDIPTYFNIRGQVEATGHYAILTITYMVPIQVEVCTLTNALKLYKELAGGLIGLCDFKLFPIPADGICQINDIFSESLIAIEGIR